MASKTIKVSDKVVIGNDLPIAVIAGPCVIESQDHAIFMAAQIKKIASSLKIPFIFKASFDKANRSSIDSYRGPGIKDGLEILAKVKKSVGVPIITDIHIPQQADEAAKIADIIQIPAFLSRQTDLIKAAAQTGKPVNIKKGQFLAPEDMAHVVKKAQHYGCKDISLTERGASFGYHNLVVDFRGIEIMKKLGCPVIFDATHSVQLPGGLGNKSGGDKEFILPLSKAAVAVGVAAVFMETHDNPQKALSDGANSIDLKNLKATLSEIKKIDKAVK
ncbi:MAG: 3-deoxy-8-phosphooctulonate synthase [Elusimicrobiota bacterium]|jgi:2-dehydro-3-deoxyphosphooctonate aldolase (KDO 8-P synthase)|nr:3-deoxy-8-phosphooctulonate synthase [Elusimicrobiota bacterium]